MSKSFVYLAVGIATALAAAVPASDSAAPGAIAQVKENLRRQAYEAVPKADRAHYGEKEFPQWRAHLRADGSYTDLDYEDDHRPDWGPLNHLGRAQALLLATIYPESPNYRNAVLEAEAMKALEYWASRSFKPHYNWWHMEIGQPRVTFPMLLLFESRFSSRVRNALLKATRLGHLKDHPSNWSATGQNLVWFAETTIALGAITGNAKWVQESVDAITAELRQDGAETGLQADESFFQHGAVMYNFGYGLGFMRDMTRLIGLVHGTSFAMPEEVRDRLIRFVAEGQLWMIQGKTLDYSVRGRQYARANDSDSASVRDACASLAAMPSRYAAFLRRCSEVATTGKGRVRLGNRLFYRGDYMTHNREGFGISLKFLSSRTLNADATPMGEGIKSHYLADGATYIYRSGDEYWNIHPLWDFNRVPGTTESLYAPYPGVPASENLRWYGKTAFAGGVSDGEYGAATMDFRERKLSAKKSWFFSDRGVIALGAGVGCSGCGTLATSINQEWSKGEMTYGNARQSFRLVDGKKSVSGSSWAHANGVGYLVPAGQLVLQNQEQVGSWKSIARALPADPVKGKVTSLWIEHGENPSGRTYAYAVYPGASESEMKRLSAKPDFTILSNTPAIQAVSFRDRDGEEVVQAIFHSPGTLSWGLNHVTVKQPCAILVRTPRMQVAYPVLFVSSPGQDQTQIEITAKVSSFIDRTFRVRMPQGQYAGATVRRLFNNVPEGLDLPFSMGPVSGLRAY
jgi:chondroitin AC lyase